MKRELKKIEKEMTSQIREARFAFPLFLMKTISLYAIIVATILFFIISLLIVSYAYPSTSFYTVPVSILLAYILIYNSIIYRGDWLDRYVGLENKTKSFKNKVAIDNETRERFGLYLERVLIAVKDEEVSVEELKEIKKIHLKLKQLSKYFEREPKEIRRIREAIKSKEKAFELHEQSLRVRSKPAIGKAQKPTNDRDNLARVSNKVELPVTENSEVEEIKEEDAQETTLIDKPIVEKSVSKDPILKEIQNEIDITLLLEETEDEVVSIPETPIDEIQIPDTSELDIQELFDIEHQDLNANSQLTLFVENELDRDKVTELKERKPLRRKPKIVEKKKIRKIVNRRKDYFNDKLKAKEIGDLGEMLVFEYELNRLKELNLPNWRSRVRHIAKDEGDGAGYDIVSADKNRNEIFIEVKTTTNNNDFFITSNELKVMEQKKKQYYIYRVFLDTVHNDSRVEIYAGEKEIKEYFTFIPSKFKVSLKSKI